MQDPIHSVLEYTNVAGDANAFLQRLHGAFVTAGWVIDEYDTTPNINSLNGGHELYVHTNDASFSEQSYFSFKALRGQGDADHQGILVYANTGYDPTRRVDNQPGMFARNSCDTLNQPAWTAIFSGQWDGAGPNADPMDPGLYKTWNGSVPEVPNNCPQFNVYKTSQLDKVWIFYTTGRTLSVLWYVGNQLYGLCVGKVYYDNEGQPGENMDGTLLAGWCDQFQNRNLVLPPINDSLAGARTSPLIDQYPFVIVRQRTNGGVTWPAGTPTGAPMMGCGTVVKNNDRLEAQHPTDQAQTSAIHRPNQSFGASRNNLQLPHVPDPQVTIHYEVNGTQHRRGLARHRSVSRWPNGGALTGTFSSGTGVTDWADSRFFFPWYFATCAGLVEGGTITNGTRQYRVFPGCRAGADLFAAHRWAGIGFRTA